MVKLHRDNQEVSIEAGELVSYRVEGHEYMHQKGSPGWRSTDTEMFPIIGPTAEANFQVNTPNGKAIQDQHGLLREMDYHLTESTATTAIFQKEYEAGTRVKNSKFPEKSTEKEVFWPYSFQFEKHFRLKESQLEITFKISGDSGMPFMLGYHPAFMLRSDNPVLTTAGKEIGLSEVLAVGSRALHVPDCNEIILKDEKKVMIKTEGFSDFMLWTEVSNMICIEPISFYPYAVNQKNLDKGFNHLGEGSKEFKVRLRPDNS